MVTLCTIKVRKTWQISMNSNNDIQVRKVVNFQKSVVVKCKKIIMNI
jgi:hypothetical protein